jgi:hypothetical protein
VLKVEYEGVVARSSAVASVAHDLLEEGILDQLWSETKKALAVNKHFRLCVVRSSRSSTPTDVQLERDSRSRVLVRSFCKGNDRASIIKDSLIDCRENKLEYNAEDRHTSRMPPFLNCLKKC